MNPDDDLLTHVEKDSQTWLAIQRWAAARRLVQDDALRQRGVTERNADFHRGKANAYTEILAFADKLNEKVTHE